MNEEGRREKEETSHRSLTCSPRPILHSAFNLSPYFMTDLKFAFRQLLKNPGFTAVAVLTLGSGGRTLDGCRSTPIASRLPAAVPPRDSSVSHARTMLGGRSADVPDADLGVPVILETCGRSSGRPVECQAAVPGGAAKKSVCRVKSRMAVKLGLRCPRAGCRILPKFRLSLIQQRAQSRTWARVADDPFPRRITIQLRQQSWQTRYEFLAFLRGEGLDSFLDFLHRAHASKLPRRKGPGKPRMAAIHRTRLTVDS